MFLSFVITGRRGISVTRVMTGKAELNININQGNTKTRKDKKKHMQTPEEIYQQFLGSSDNSFLKSTALESVDNNYILTNKVNSFTCNLLNFKHEIARLEQEKKPSSVKYFQNCDGSVINYGTVGWDEDELHSLVMGFKSRNSLSEKQFSHKKLQVKLASARTSLPDEYPVITDKVLSLPQLHNLLMEFSVSSKSVIKVDRKNVKKHAFVFDTQQKIRKAGLEAAAYVSACIKNGEAQHAHHFLVVAFMNSKSMTTSQKRKWMILDSEPYEHLIWEWLKKKEVEKINQLIRLMESAKVPYNASIASALLIALDVQSKAGKTEVEKLLFQLKNEGISLDDLSAGCDIEIFHRKKLQEIVQKVKPEFKVQHPLQTQSGHCRLFDKLEEDGSQASNPYAGVLSEERILQNLERQLDWEKKDSVTVPSLLASADVSSKVQKMRNHVAQIKQEWMEALGQAVPLELEHRKKKAKKFSINLSPFIAILSVDEIVDTIMKELMILVLEDTYSFTTVSLSARLAESIYKKVQAKECERSGKLQKIKALYQMYIKQVNSPNSYLNGRKFWIEKMQEFPELDYLIRSGKRWPPQIMSLIGSFLYQMIKANLLVDVNLLNKQQRELAPAFYSVKRQTARGNYAIQLKPHPVVTKVFEAASPEEMSFPCMDVPMLVPPVPWVHLYSGCYLSHAPALVRLPFAGVSDGYLDGHLGALSPVFDAINSAQYVPWIINKKVLDTVIRVYRSGGNLSLDIPCPAELVEMKQAGERPTEGEKYDLLKRMKEMHSLRMTELYRLSIAHKFRDEVFWFPHNIDFRGRMYCVPSHLNHIGNDVSRGILMFAKKEKLGKDGLDWLKIHLVNLTGLGKALGNSARLELANSLAEEIKDSAENPMEGNLWWQKSDDPWQTLACCIEINNASKLSNPSQYESHFPVHQDGSCNGLQHYAALGRDVIGAKSVNLLPFDQPSDVYEEVASVVEKKRKQDAEKGREIAQKLEGFVTRRIVKPTVMTSVYGVTRYGAVSQINTQLGEQNFPLAELNKASRYLMELVFNSLKEMFTSAREIQTWFNICADACSLMSGKPMQWITPLQLPVMQPYYKLCTISYKSSNNHLMTLTMQGVNRRKQRNGLAPNFIHSLDASHMMLTALYSLRAGISFISVHDCYWTHPKHVLEMNKICRQQFIALYQEPILQNLSRHLLENFGYPHSFEEGEIISEKGGRLLNTILTEIPPHGDFDIRKVQDSVYFFS